MAGALTPVSITSTIQPGTVASRADRVPRGVGGDGVGRGGYYMTGCEPDPGSPGRVGATGGTRSPSDLASFCDRYRSQAVGYAFAILHDRATAEDAVQLALTRIVARVAEGDEALLDRDPERVIIRNTRWAALELAKRRRHAESLEMCSEHAEAKVAADSEWDRAQARFLCEQIAASLPAHYRDVLRMRYVEQFADAEGASRLRLSLKAYRCRVDRALQAARLSATRLSIDSLRGLVVAGWCDLTRRAARMHGAGRAASNLEESSWAYSGALHGVLALLLAGGVAALPIVIGGSGRDLVGPPNSVGARLGGAVSSTSRASQLAVTVGQGPCAGCDQRPNSLAVTTGGLPVTVMAPSVPQVVALPGSAGTLGGQPSVLRLRAVAESALGTVSVLVGSATSPASGVAGGLAPAAPPAAPTVPTP